MRLALERRRPAPGSDAALALVEVITPRTNLATLSSAENLIGAVALAGASFSLELAADRQHRRVCIRTAHASMRRQLATQIGAAYPQADLRDVAPADDPLRVDATEQVAAAVLELRAPAYLPIRTFADLDLDGERAAQADPLLAVLAALGDLPAGWRGVSQLVLRPAPEDWYGGDARRAVQHPLAHEQLPGHGEAAGPTVVFVALLLGLLLAGLQGFLWFQAGAWLPLASMLTLGVGATVLLGRYLPRRLRPRIYDMQLVRDKVSRPAYYAELRLVILAPADAPAVQLEQQLERLAAAYRHYHLAGANGFRARRLRLRSAEQLAQPRPLRPRRPSLLTTRELAGLWHLPHAAADVPLLERTSARRFLPLPGTVQGGCRIGVALQQGRQVPVALPEDVLRRHLLLVAKTRRGKSTLLLRLAQHAMSSTPRRALLLVDPHRDLAESVLGVVPPERRADVVALDVADAARPVGLNLLDTGLGWSRDRAVANSLAIFQREWGDRFWGPRMEDAFRFALLSLFEANLQLEDRAAQYTLLDIPALLCEPPFRRRVLAAVTDPTIQRWWSEYFEPLDRRFQLEIVNPVLTKIHRFQGSDAARRIIGQPASSIQPADWLRRGAIVVVNTARGSIGENAAALVGGTLLNLVALAVAEQAQLEPHARAPISLIVDEFHTIPGADYEAILAELSKYGANLVLATQSLARLLSFGRDDGRDVRALVFANLDGLFAFNCSAEDARYLIPELGGALDEQDLVELGEHQCYVRISTSGERLPTFSVKLDPPLAADPQLQRELAARSAARYGRPVAEVDAMLSSAVARIKAARTEVQTEAAPARRRRNEHRPRKKPNLPLASEAPAHG